MKKEDQLNSVSVPLGTSIVTMATKECQVNTQSNVISMVKEVLYDLVIEEKENERSPACKIDKIREKIIKHDGANNKDCRDSIEHLDQVRATETKECCNIAFMSCEKILKKEKEEDINVSTSP